MPKPDADLCMRVDLPLNKKTVENQDWATGPPGRQAVAGRWAFGPPGRWAAGLLLAKPKLIQSEMKPAPEEFTARVGVWLIAVFAICSAFLFCNYLLMNQRIATTEGRLREDLLKSEKPNPNISFDGQRGTKQVLHAREKRSVKQKTQVSTIADLEERLQALEKRYFTYIVFAVVGCRIQSLVLADINLLLLDRIFF